MGTNRLSLLLDDIDTVILFLLIIFPIQNQIFSMLKGDLCGATYCSNLYNLFSICTLHTVLKAQVDN